MITRLFLLRELVRRDFQARYAGSLLGFFWSFVQPLWQLVLFTVVFSAVLKVPLVGERTEHFALFLFCGLLPWMAVQEGLARSASAVTDNATLVKKLHFPSGLLPLSVVLTAILHEGIAASVFVALLLLTGELAWRGLPLLLVALPLQLGLTLGFGLLLAGLQVFFRDTAQLLGMLLQAWFYLTPIVYPQALMPQLLRGWNEVNPLAALVTLYRQALLGAQPVAPRGLLSLVAVTAVALALGAWSFRRLKPTFADEV